MVEEKGIAIDMEAYEASKKEAQVGYDLAQLHHMVIRLT
jgi:hypothetical protein